MSAEKEVLKDMAGKLVPEPIVFTVKTAYPKGRTFLEKVLGKKKEPAERTFELKPFYLGTLLQMAPYLLDMEIPAMSNENMYEKLLSAMNAHIADQCIIIALAINNDETRPSTELAEYIRRNFTAQMLKDVSQVIVNSLDLTSFLSTIILMKKGVSLLNTGETIDPSRSPVSSAA